MEKRKGKDYFYKYSDSPEYSDFELLLEIAKELGLDVRVINFPINGKWNDYIGVDAEQRKIYREKLTNIVQSYGYSIFDLGIRNTNHTTCLIQYILVGKHGLKHLEIYINSLNKVMLIRKLIIF